MSMGFLDVSAFLLFPTSFHLTSRKRHFLFLAVRSAAVAAQAAAGLESLDFSILFHTFPVFLVTFC